MSLVGEKAPLFTAMACNGEELSAEIFPLANIVGKEEILLFFFPMELAEVYKTEIMVLQALLPEFEKRNVSILGISTGSGKFNNGGLLINSESGSYSGVLFPIVSDPDGSISKHYSVTGGYWDCNENGEIVYNETPTQSTGIFLIDKKGIVRYESINFFSFRKSINDVLKVLEARDFEN